MLKQRNTTIWGHREVLERKLLSPGVCTSHSVWLMESGKSYKIACEICRGPINSGMFNKLDLFGYGPW